MIDAGADVIFGHHAHRLQPMDTYRGRPIFYGLGNFVWPDFSDEGIDHRGREGRRHAGRTDQRPVAPRVHHVARSPSSSLMHLASVARDLPCRRREARPNETVW